MFGVYGVTSRVNAVFSLPYLSRRQTAEVADAHHRSETMQGVRDLRLGVRYIASNAQFGPGERLFFGVDLTFPTAASYSANPFADGADTLRHRHFALGTGTTVATLYAEWWHRSEFPWVTGLIVRFSPRWNESALGFQPGTSFSIDLHAINHTHRLWRSFPYLTLRMRWEGSDYWEQARAPNSGGVFVEGGAGLDVELSESISGVLRLSAPIWTRLTGSQLTGTDVNLSLRARF